MAKLLSLAQSVDPFEAAWQLGVPPTITDFLPSADESHAGGRLATLQELVCIDLEYRWRRDGRKRGARTWTLEDYAREFSELGSLSATPLPLIAEEFRVRHRFGDRPQLEAYRSRWPERWSELEPLLGQVLEELREEYLAAGRSQEPSYLGTICSRCSHPLSGLRRRANAWQRADGEGLSRLAEKLGAPRSSQVPQEIVLE